MKTLITLLALIASISAGAQTFVNYKVNNWISGPQFTTSTNFTVGSNTVVRILNILGTDQVTGMTVTISYPNSPAVVLDAGAVDIFDVPVLGPFNATATFTAASASGQAGFFLMQYDTVNTTSAPGGVAVIPAGFDAMMSLETSTNLTSWTAITNKPYTKAAGNRFFRMKLDLD